MRLPIILGSAALLMVAGLSQDAHAQGIRIGKLKQLTAPYISGSIELMAIGYEADTVDTDERPSLFGFSGQLEPSSLTKEALSNVTFALDETIKPNGDCLTCELRDDREAILMEEQFAFLLQH